MIRLIQTQKILDENKFDVDSGLVWINKTQKIIGPMFFLNASGPPCTQIHLFYQIYSFEYKIPHHMYQNKTVEYTHRYSMFLGQFLPINDNIVLVMYLEL